MKNEPTITRAIFDLIQNFTAEELLDVLPAETIQHLHLAAKEAKKLL